MPTWNVEVVDETGSTNADLVQAAAAGAPHGQVLVANHQTAGRGRLDRRWEAPPSTNLLASVLFRTGWTFPHELTQRVALAAGDAATRLTGVKPSLKWPNDLLIDGNKLAGVLAQAGPGFVVVGIGVNLGWAPEGAARLAGVDRDEYLEAWLDAMATEWPTEIGPRYRAELATLGQRVRVERPGGDLVGVAVAVEEDGTLVVQPPTGPAVQVTVGDVIHLRPA